MVASTFDKLNAMRDPEVADPKQTETNAMR